MTHPWLIGLAFLSFTVSAAAAEPAPTGSWGSIKSRVVFDGQLNPAQAKRYRDDVSVYEPLTVKQMLQGVKPKVLDKAPNQSLLVDPKTHGLKNVFVYLQQRPASIHPRAVERHAKPLEMNCRQHEFWPRHVIASVGETAHLRTDKDGCDFKIDFSKNAPFHGSVTLQKPLDLKLATAEPAPVRVSSVVQPSAVSYWLVLDHPYAALTAADGSFQLEDMPAGEHELFVWHETVGYVAKSLKVVVQAGGVTELAPLPLTADRLK
jgi:hypothetical protein